MTSEQIREQGVTAVAGALGRNTIRPSAGELPIRPAIPRHTLEPESLSNRMARLLDEFDNLAQDFKSLAEDNRKRIEGLQR